MKSILLTTTALVAFAGAAVADGHTGISFTGEATLGYNSRDFGGTDLDPATGAPFEDEDGEPISNDNNSGFYWDASLDVSMAAELDNGLTAGASFEIDVAEDDTGLDLSADSYVLSLEYEEAAALFYGDTAFAAETHWNSAGDMEADGFSEADGEVALRGDFELYGVSASLSAVIADEAGAIVGDSYEDDDFDQISVGAAAEFGNFSVSFGYQDESLTVDGVTGDYDPSGNGDFNVNEVVGLSVGTSFAGADVTAAAASNLTTEETSLGFEVSYPFGPVTATAYYVVEDGGADVGNSNDDNYGITLDYVSGPIAVTADYDYDQGTDKYALEGSYDVGNGITALAGIVNEDEDDDIDYYVAGTYDMGGGAELLVSYAEDVSNDQEDEVGDPEYQEGVTIEVSFSF